MRPTLIVMSLLAVLALAACGGSDGGADDPDDIAGWREQVRSTAATLVPDLAATFGAETGPAEGQYQASGGGVAARAFAYSVAVTLTGGDASAGDVEAALDELGYEVSKTPVPNGTTSITATQGGTRVLVTVPDDTSRPLAVAVTSPFVKVSSDEAATYEGKGAKEPLELK